MLKAQTFSHTVLSIFAMIMGNNSNQHLGSQALF
jgi:hypothetical protein